MSKTSIRRIAQYAGIVAAVAVPALVVGQDVQVLQGLNLGDGSVLRGQDVRALRDALAVAVARIDDLESRLANQGGGIGKGDLYTVSNAVPIAIGARETAKASCQDPADVAIDCACGGNRTDSTAGSPFNELRIIATDNPAGALSSCQCVGENVGTNTTQQILAIVTCLSS